MMLFSLNTLPMSQLVSGKYAIGVPYSQCKCLMKEMEADATYPIVGVDAACASSDIGRDAILVVRPEPHADVLRRAL